jgi:hypothetical protein
LYPVEIVVLVVVVAVVAVAVAAAVVAAAGMRTDRGGERLAEAEHLEYWEMIADGKTIELTSGRWKEIW